MLSNRVPPAPARICRILVIGLVTLIQVSCRSSPSGEQPGDAKEVRELPFSLDPEPGVTIRTAGFVVLDQVFNSELMAPYDVLQHSVFRDKSDYIQPFIVAPSLDPVQTFEGIELLPHFTFDSAPAIDILVIPSTDHGMSADLDNDEFMQWLKRTVEGADYVVTLCDGAFPLAATGVLNGRVATTFPGDREQLQAMFPDVDVRFDVRLVQDGKYITSVGGGMSYEPAFYLVEMLYGRDHALQTAEGLVWDWDAESVPMWIGDSGSRGHGTVDRP